MTRQARKNTNLVENLKEINWWFDTLVLKALNERGNKQKIAFFCVSASIYDMKFGMNFWTNVTLLYQY